MVAPVPGTSESVYSAWKKSRGRDRIAAVCLALISVATLAHGESLANCGDGAWASQPECLVALSSNDNRARLARQRAEHARAEREAEEKHRAKQREEARIQQEKSDFQRREEARYQTEHAADRRALEAAQDEHDREAAQREAEYASNQRKLKEEEPRHSVASDTTIRVPQEPMRSQRKAGPRRSAPRSSP